MFLSLAKLYAEAGGTREQVLLLHPEQLSRWLEEAWAGASLVPELPLGSSPTSSPFLGDDAIIGTFGLPLQVPSALLLPSGVVPPDTTSWTPVLGPPGASGVGLMWHHLAYAYLIESSGVCEIFLEVVRRLVVGETLGTIDQDASRWLRATEELFYRDPPLFSIAGMVSEARPHARISRRNAYWRMFGMDLPHPAPATTGPSAQQGWKADVGLGVNTDFRTTWEELLRQVWTGLVNSENTSGTNETDPSYVSLLCQSLGDMFNNRRQNGLLAREEFAYVTMLSWFHLTLQTNTPIVVALKAEATSPGQRLSKIAQRVGMTPAARSREMFEVAEPISSVLRAIELGTFDDPIAASALYDGTTALGVEMRNLVNHWAAATGAPVKDMRVGAGTGSGTPPLRVSPAPMTPSAPSQNGSPQPVLTSNGSRP